MIENLKNKILLYAEDEISIQNQYAHYFKNIFKEIYVVDNGEEGLSVFKTKKPDVAILDINMPKMNGIELTKKIKSISPMTPIILLTAKSDKETLKEAIELQLLTYLEKPVSRNDLKEALTKLSKQFENDNIINLWNDENGMFYTWDKTQKTLFANNEKVKLTKRESSLISLFIEKNTTCTYQDIYEYVWEDSDKEYNESTIKTLISSLKQKLPKNAIINNYGIGYSIK